MSDLSLSQKVEKSYSKRMRTPLRRVTSSIEKSQIDMQNISNNDLREITSTFIDMETSKLKTQIDELLVKKEMIEKELELKSQQLQDIKNDVFDAIAQKIEADTDVMRYLNQIKLESIDLYDILSEKVELTLINTLEKNNQNTLCEDITEDIKDITFESIKDGSLNSIRVKKILSTILSTSIDIAEATPNQSYNILKSTLKGMRSGFIKSIENFKKQIAYMPTEAKQILIDDYDTTIESLKGTETLFSQVIITEASNSSLTIRTILMDLKKEMKYDLDELILISKETTDIVKDKFSNIAKIATTKADIALKSQQAQDIQKITLDIFSNIKKFLNGIKNG